MKIVKAYPILEPTLHQSVTEAGWLDRISQGLGMGQKPPNQKPAVTPDVARSTATAEAEDPLGHVVSAIVKPLTSGQSRFVVKLNRAELTSLYLKDDPKAHLQLAKALLGVTESVRYALISMFEDPATGEPNEDPDSVAAAAKDAGVAPKPAPKVAPKAVAKPKSTAPVRALPAGYKFSDLVKSNSGKNYTVLLDVPNQLAKAYQGAATPENLAQLFNHRYYVTTIDNSRAAKIAPLMDKAGNDTDAELTAFNPDIIVNYPAAQTIKQAKLAWAEKYEAKHQALTGVKPPAAAAPTSAPAAPAVEPKAGEAKPEAGTAEKPAETAELSTAKLDAAHKTLLALARTMPSKGPQAGSRKALDNALNIINLSLRGAALPKQ